MFKNNREKEVNYINSDEVEKLYELQRKSFEAKILEQQKKIDELTDYISVRFGENVAKSNIASKLNNIEKDLKDIQDNYKAYMERTTKELTKQVKKENEKIAAELNDIQTESYFKLLQKNEKDLEKVQETITENKENSKKILELDEIVNNHIKNYEEHKEDVQKELNETKKKLDKVNYTGITGKFDKKIKEECSKLKNKLEESNEQIKNDVIKQSEDIANLVGNLDERLSTEIVLINEQLGETINQTSSKNEELTNKVTGANKKIEDVSKNLSELETKLNENTSELKTELAENISELKTEVFNNSNEFEARLEEKTSEFEKELKTNKDKISTNYATTKKVVANLERKTTKIINDLDEKIENYKNEEKTEIENISSVIDIIRNTVDENYDNIEQEVLNFKEEITASMEQQKNNTADVEILKKEYNKFVTKMNSELAKISKSIMNAQKKSLETNQNLQAKIKTYVDNKIEKNNNISKIEELINNLDASAKQREKEQSTEMEKIINNVEQTINEKGKTQDLEMKKIINNLETTIQQREQAYRLEMEELFNKKLKAIQKENERILNKKIEELNSKFLRENTVQENTNPNKVTFYTEQPKNKKKVYELIDENQILRKTAKSKKDLLDNQEGKSQILKFFYDEEE